MVNVDLIKPAPPFAQGDHFDRGERIIFEKATKVYRSTWQALSEVARKDFRTTYINGYPYAAWRIWFGTTRTLEQWSPPLSPTTVDVGTVTEYGLTQKLSRPIRCF